MLKLSHLIMGDSVTSLSFFPFVFATDAHVFFSSGGYPDYAFFIIIFLLLVIINIIIHFLCYTKEAFFMIQ